MRRRREVIDRHGPWTLHNIELADGVYTIGPPDPAAPWTHPNLRRVLQVTEDLAGKPLSELRVLDLASHEGGYGIELARRGAKVVAVEGRTANLEKARLAQEWFELDGLELVQDDVRKVTSSRYGEFDVVLCLGILYHLTAADAVGLLSQIAGMCLRLTVVDTHAGMSPRVSHRDGDRLYWGRLYPEHDPESDRASREEALGASIDNPTSFWFTRPSLHNLLMDVGFTSVYECVGPPAYVSSADRPTVVALKGTAREPLALPELAAAGELRWPERSRRRVHPSQAWWRQLLVGRPRLRAVAGRARRALRLK